VSAMLTRELCAAALVWTHLDIEIFIPEIEPVIVRYMYVRIGTQ